ncbi:kinase-like domain-containing protein [Collybia nuda]|uniref:Kinase-like domain-containing protein n=1 Tax=Collybia nuda TaxID=64659 RepID=A0A9P6C8C9_9AGAR|nr:kinase-like domain-containing protein [Collybia nuda]
MDIERLGEWHETSGGFAIVYIAHWRNNGRKRKVGVKVIKTPAPHGCSGDKIANKRLRSEIMIWSRLDHPNILPLLGITYGFGAQGVYGMVCPWIDNGDLSHYLKVNEGISLPERITMLSEIAEALYYLHSNSVVHGDLTGNNILVADDGKMLLCDFGLSSIKEDYSKEFYHTTSTPKYNLPWTAPEIVLSEFPPRPNQKTDVYSFGSVMLQVLSGTRPYHGMAEGMIVLSLFDLGIPPRPEGVLVSDDLWSFMLKCWDRNPQKRLVVADIRDYVSLVSV